VGTSRGRRGERGSDDDENENEKMNGKTRKMVPVLTIE